MMIWILSAWYGFKKPHSQFHEQKFHWQIDQIAQTDYGHCIDLDSLYVFVPLKQWEYTKYGLKLQWWGDFHLTLFRSFPEKSIRVLKMRHRNVSLLSLKYAEYSCWDFCTWTPLIQEKNKDSVWLLNKIHFHHQKIRTWSLHRQ